MIKCFYGNGRAERSKVPLINHIVEGVAILDEIDASHRAKLAFCIHPMVQNEKDLAMYWHKVTIKCNSDVVLMAMEYRRAANAFLCRPETDHYRLEDLHRVVGEHLLPDVRDMLIADKRQNQKDFNIYYRETHPRRMELARYFELWREYLGG